MGIENNDIDNMLQYLETAPYFIDGGKIEKIREMLGELRKLRESHVWSPPEDVTLDDSYPCQESNKSSVFDVILIDVGHNKIGVIKTIRELTGLGLKESKEMTDDVVFHTNWTTQQLYDHGRFVRRGLKRAEAEQVRAKLAEVGAKALLIDGHGQRWVRLECKR
jgi:ribosomal protein L7/L12